MPAFGGGLTYCSLLVKWGSRVTPLGTSDRELPPCTETALELVNEVRATQDPHGRSLRGLMAPVFVESPFATETVSGRSVSSRRDALALFFDEQSAQDLPRRRLGDRLDELHLAHLLVR